MLIWLKVLYYKAHARITGKNTADTPPEVIIDQMMEKRPLPTGMTEFEEWSDRIISGTMLKASPESQKFALAGILTQLKETTDHECDGFFIKALRKSAINQVAQEKMRQLHAAKMARDTSTEAQKVSNDANLEGAAI